MVTERYIDLLKQGFMKPQAAPRVAFKTYRKIDLFLKREGRPLEYLASTNASKTCREARERYAKIYGLEAAQIVAIFSK